FGYDSGGSNTTGIRNTFVGANAGDSNTDGNNNAFFGYDSGGANSTGDNNAFIGNYAGNANTTGSNNTILGVSADVSSGALTNATAIGNGAPVNASNKIRVGNASVTVIEGQVDWTFPSDARFKFNIRNDVPGLAFINKLKPVTYQFDTRKFEEHLMQNMPDSVQQRRMAGQDYSESSARAQTGFLAQEVEQVCKDLGFEFGGLHVPASEVDNYGLAYGSFVPLLVKGMQEQQAEIEQLKMENERLKKVEAQLEKITAALQGAGIAVEK
ncbi:MAG: tail fiber domain-containing protein, partial [Bacteroidota bacterium]